LYLAGNNSYTVLKPSPRSASILVAAMNNERQVNFWECKNLNFVSIVIIFRLTGVSLICVTVNCNLWQLQPERSGLLFSLSCVSTFNEHISLVFAMNNENDVHVTTDGNIGSTSHGMPPPMQPPALPLSSVVIGLVTGVVGMCSNAVILVVLTYARRHFGSNVNTLIANQSAMDLAACIFLTLSFGMSTPGAPQNYAWLGEFGNNLVCTLFRGRMLTVVCMNAEKFGRNMKSVDLS